MMLLIHLRFSGNIRGPVCKKHQHRKPSLQMEAMETMSYRGNETIHWAANALPEDRTCVCSALSHPGNRHRVWYIADVHFLYLTFSLYLLLYAKFCYKYLLSINSFNPQMFVACMTAVCWLITWRILSIYHVPGNVPMWGVKPSRA